MVLLAPFVLYTGWHKSRLPLIEYGACIACDLCATLSSDYSTMPG